MVNIVMTRIDSGLLHSRVTTQWFSCTGGNLILVANDRVAESKLLQGLMDMAADMIWQLDGNVLTAYNLETMTFCEMEIPEGRITGLDVSEAGTAVLYDSEKNLVYFSEFSD